MALAKTLLYLRLTPINPKFKGDPQDYAEELISHLEIVAPFGITTFVVGSQMPATNQGPWLANGTQWWVWSDVDKTYVPLDISASLPPQYYLQAATPPTDGAAIWFKLGGVDGNEPGGLYVLINGVWKAVTGVGSGPTASRPVSPADFQQFYDTDISTLIWWERGTWRTISGVKGDVKFVTALTLADALTQNPGWSEIGGVLSADYRGRAFIAAHKDPGATPAVSFAPQPNITPRARGDLVGEELHVLVNNEAPDHFHGTAGFGQTVGDDTEAMLIKKAWDLSGLYSFNTEMDAGDGSRTMVPTNDIASGRYSTTNKIEDPTATPADGHNTVPPEVALWCLVKQ